MFDVWLPETGAWGAIASLLADRGLLIAAAIAVAFGGWRTHWRSRFARRMRLTFEMCNLYIKPRKDKRFPELIRLSKRDDELYYVFRYRLQPGMSVAQFEEKKKMFEAAFHAETKVFGKGGIVTIKVKKEKYPVPLSDRGA